MNIVIFSTGVDVPLYNADWFAKRLVERFSEKHIPHEYLDDRSRKRLEAAMECCQGLAAFAHGNRDGLKVGDDWMIDRENVGKLADRWLYCFACGEDASFLEAAAFRGVIAIGYRERLRMDGIPYHLPKEIRATFAKLVTSVVEALQEGIREEVDLRRRVSTHANEIFLWQAEQILKEGGPEASAYAARPSFPSLLLAQLREPLLRKPAPSR